MASAGFSLEPQNIVGTATNVYMFASSTATGGTDTLKEINVMECHPTNYYH